MDRLNERLQVARQAHATLLEVLSRQSEDAVIRDAAIQRFEYTFEATWKLAQLYLKQMHGQSAGSPKAAIRDSREVGLLSDLQAQRALKMADDRNLTVHTYNLSLSLDIFGRLPAHVELLGTWLDAIRVTAESDRKEG